MLRWFWLGCVSGVLVFLAGCEPTGPKTVSVSGTVSLDGQPLKEGQVTLVNSAGLVSDDLPVKDGKFSGRAKIGKVKIEIWAFRPGNPPPKDGTPAASDEPSSENYLPARYNSESKIMAEVTDGGLNPSAFEVESK
jgi:hypothetical protein